MKKIICSALFAFFTVSSSAATFYDPFNYPALENLIGQTNPDGITWTLGGSNSLNQPTIFPGNLDYPGLSPSSGNSIKFGGNGMSARFPFAAAIGSGTVYYSFILKVTDITGMSATGIFWASFNNSVGSQTAAISSAHARIVTKAAVENGTNGFLIGIDKSSGMGANFQFATNVFFTNDVIFVVASYTFNSGSSTDDEARIWINPDASSFGAASPPAPTKSATVGNDGTVFQSFVFYNRNAGEPAGMIADELLISTNWADVTPLPTTMNFTAQPRTQTVVAGINTFFDASATRAQNYQWLSNNVNIPNATNRVLPINNAQLANAGDYQVVASNPSVTKTSIVATLTVTNGDFPVLTSLWSIAPNTQPYVTNTGSGTILQQSIAYNALSNQVIIVSRTNNPSGLTINVLDAGTGNFLYQMDTSAIEAVVTGGISPLTMLAVGDDGIVYAANTTGNGTTDSYKLYRWANSGSNTVAVKVFSDGDPAYQSTAFRWGDTLNVRGTGTNTEILVDSSTLWATVFKPTDDTLTTFLTNPFTNSYTDGSLGRSLQFGTNNSYWQKRKGNRLEISAITPPDGLYGGNTLVAQNNNFPSTIGPVGFNLASNFLAGIGFALSNSVPDTLDFYQIADFNNPILLGKYNFPTTRKGNISYLGQVVVAADRVFAINGNNGVVAFAITNAPATPPQLMASLSSGQITLIWTDGTYILQGTTNLTPPIAWSDISTGGQTNKSESAATGNKYYRLRRP